LPLTPENIKNFDAVIITTDHDNVDYKLVSQYAPLIIDTRNALVAKGLKNQNTISA